MPDAIRRPSTCDQARGRPTYVVSHARELAGSGRDARRAALSRRDLAIGIAIGILLGIAIVALFVFGGGGESIDAPALKD